MIKTSGLTRHFGSLVAVDGLDLQVEAGELFGFLGPNGAGKTTTMRMLVGLLRPTSGTAMVAGHDIVQEPLAVKRRVGYLAQQVLLYDKLTGWEFLQFIGGLYGLSDEQARHMIRRLFQATFYEGRTPFLRHIKGMI